ncbi:hypothetical protein [Streptomyces sp. H27-C3]|uniref:hypothetical protein n=1 Tax=Streptomyces sp. H27-C3 TaxID=3046305 RepID=UPI0024B9EC0F|nr:hypothetical protein [Streptomyces sp. H27-C3]MDJ0461555.1 hypothetical protein [Streptomyces sp. H27-C3]
MARVRYIGPVPVTVPELGGRTIHPDEIAEVPDDRYDGYVCQSTTWEAVEEPKDEPPAPKKSPALKTVSTTKEA